jgi:hypothetical protein
MGPQLGNTLAISAMLAMVLKLGFGVEIGSGEIDAIITGVVALVILVGNVVSWFQNKDLIAENSELRATVTAMGVGSAKKRK